MPSPLDYLEGKKFCVVFMHDDSATENKVRLKALHGRASIDRRGVLFVEHENGRFQVPSSCYNLILPNDGTEFLGSAEYYVICKVAGMDL